MEILVEPEQEVSVGAGIAWLEDGKAETRPSESTAPKTATPSLAPVPSGPSAAAPATTRSEGTRISPVARKRAAEHGIDISSLSGTGPGGRIQLEDVEQAIAHGAASAKPSTPGLEPVRRAVARAMTLSATVPQFFVGRTVDCSRVNEIRAAHPAPKLSFNDFLLQAVARTLVAFPAMNAVFSGEVNSPEARIVPADGAHIGLVVALDQGLVVPVLQHVERLSLAEIARHRTALAERARNGRLQQDDAGAATFSISNLGVRGPDRFTAMLNPPQSAILAVGRVHEAAVVEDGKVCVRPVSELNLTVDHRVADGRLAAEFLDQLVRTLKGRDWMLE
jgi:pyruvate dehydrogenase E2 component (dihydrolipoamide acetyltransferase)